MDKLTIYAGEKALQHIRKNGLSPADISSVFGASGAAKWLTIAGLDRAIFTDFLPRADNIVHLHGTSIGAFKLCCAAQQAPGPAIDRLATAYIEQVYHGNFKADYVATQIRIILEKVFTPTAAEEILTSSKYRFSCAVTECKGYLASSALYKQQMGMMKALLLAVKGRSKLTSMMERVIFTDARAMRVYQGNDDYQTRIVSLNGENLQSAVLASGSIPLVMNGVDLVGSTQAYGTFRDGGLIDYHPVPENVLAENNGLVLYPHFYSWLIEGWFDKFFKSRKVHPDRLSNVIIVTPGQDYVRSLPGERIPDRHDFYRYKRNEPERQRRWHEAVERSFELGEQWMEWVKTGDLASKVTPIKV